VKAILHVLTPGVSIKKQHLEKKKRRKRPGIVPALGPFNKGFACGPAIFNKNKGGGRIS
jgi:hypothetical protein